MQIQYGVPIYNKNMSLLETRQKAFEKKLATDYTKLSSMGESAGFVYVCTNSVWPTACKVGCTKDPITRVASYSGYDPFNAYKLVAFKLVENMREYEKLIHGILKDRRLNGEWFDVDWTRATGIIHEPHKSDLILKGGDCSRKFRGKPEKLINQKLMLKIDKTHKGILR